jgi:hypothetical protein
MQIRVLMSFSAVIEDLCASDEYFGSCLNLVRKFKARLLSNPVVVRHFNEVKDLKGGHDCTLLALHHRDVQIFKGHIERLQDSNLST